MRTILFVILPFPSHYTASFGLAREWRNRGFRILYTGYERFGGLVEDEGFELIEFQYIIEYNIKNFNTFLGLFIKSIINKSYTKSRYREFYNAQLEVERIYSQYKPEQVFIDEHFAEYYFFFKKYQIEKTIINTKLSTKKVKGIPPLNSDFEPKNNFLSNLYCEFLWLNHLSKLRFQEFLQKIAFVGKDEIFFWKRLCKKNGWNWKDEIALNHSFNRSIKSIKSIILAPRELEYNFRKSQDNEEYFHVPMQKNEERYKTNEYQTLINDIKKYRANPNFKVIYVAFGTLSGMVFYSILEFLRRLTEVIKKEPNVLLVISRGNLEFDLSISSNVRVFNYMPQIDFLKHVDLMVSHGGLGTIKECFDTKVPMYILPLNKRVDQVGNAVRIECNKLGIKANIHKITDEELRKGISLLLDKASLGFSKINNNCTNFKP